MLEYRQYVETKRAIERADASGNADSAPHGAMAEIVNLNMFRLAQREIDGGDV